MREKLKGRNLKITLSVMLLILFSTILCLENTRLDVQAETYHLSEVGFENYTNLEVIQSDVGHYHSIALTADGRVFTWGRNNYGQLGDGNNIDLHTPTEITQNFTLDSGETIVQVHLGFDTSSALSSDGKVFIWGENLYGQIGNATTLSSNEPVDITGNFNLGALEKVVMLSLGESHAGAVTNMGRLFMWGYNGEYGLLGDGTVISVSTPMDITEEFNLNVDEKITIVGLGRFHSAAYTSEGRLFTWGLNDCGQLGDDTYVTHTTPTLMTSNLNLETTEEVISISLGDDHSAILTSLGNMYTWGCNKYGCLGDGTVLSKITAMDITTQFNLNPSETIISIKIVGDNSSALTSMGRMFAWGYNFYGQIGNDSTTQQLTPYNVNPNFQLDAGEVIIYANIGNFHSTAVTSDNRVFTWGRNNYGQLGDETILNGHLPIDITSSPVIVDTIAPVISLIGDATIYVELGSTYIEQGATYIDNVDASGNATVGGNTVDKSVLGTYIVTYNITDSSSNVATEVTRTVIVQDSIAPVLSLNPSLDSLDVGEVYIEQSITVDEQTEYTIDLTGSVDTSQSGVYIITYTVADEGGNETIIIRYVTVSENIPEFVLGAAKSSIRVGEEYTDGTCTVLVNDQEYNCIVKENNIDNTTIGIYTITYSYTLGDKEYTFKRYVFVYDGANILTLYCRKEEESDLL